MGELSEIVEFYRFSYYLIGKSAMSFTLCRCCAEVATLNCRKKNEPDWIKFI
jgi:hypothetical protein